MKIKELINNLVSKIRYKIKLFYIYYNNISKHIETFGNNFSSDQEDKLENNLLIFYCLPAIILSIPIYLFLSNIINFLNSKNPTIEIISLLLAVNFFLLIYLIISKSKYFIEEMNFPQSFRSYIGNLLFDMIIYLCLYLNTSRMSGGGFHKTIEIFNPLAWMIFLYLTKIVFIKIEKIQLKLFLCFTFLMSWYSYDQAKNKITTTTFFLFLSFVTLSIIFYFKSTQNKISYFNEESKFYKSHFSMLILNAKLCFFIFLTFVSLSISMIFIFKHGLTVEDFSKYLIFKVNVVFCSFSLGILWVQRIFYYFFYFYDSKFKRKILKEEFRTYLVEISMNHLYCGSDLSKNKFYEIAEDLTNFQTNKTNSAKFCNYFLL